jgi:hypothetical protein
MTSMMWSQSSQQEKLEQRKAEIKRRLEKTKMLMLSQRKNRAMNVFKKQD